MRPVYTRRLYRHALYARVYLRDTRQWPITDARINGRHSRLHSARIEHCRFVYLQCNRTSIAPPPPCIAIFCNVSWKSLFRSRVTCETAMSARLEIDWQQSLNSISMKPTATINAPSRIENIRVDVADSRKSRLPMSQMASFGKFGHLLLESLHLFFPKTCFTVLQSCVSYLRLSFFNKL